MVLDVTRLLVGIGWVANAIGAAVVFMAIGFLAAIFFGATERDQLGRQNLPVVIACITLFGAALTVLLKRRRATALAGATVSAAPKKRVMHAITTGRFSLPNVVAVAGTEEDRRQEPDSHEHARRADRVRHPSDATSRRVVSWTRRSSLGLLVPRQVTPPPAPAPAPPEPDRRAGPGLIVMFAARRLVGRAACCSS